MIFENASLLTSTTGDRLVHVDSKCHPERSGELASSDPVLRAQPAISLQEQRSSNELALEAKAGNESAFVELFRRYRPRLIRFLESRNRNSEDLEDIVQITLTKAWKAIEQFNPKYQFTTWLYTIATRPQSSVA